MLDRNPSNEMRISFISQFSYILLLSINIVCAVAANAAPVEGRSTDSKAQSNFKSGRSSPSTSNSSKTEKTQISANELDSARELVAGRLFTRAANLIASLKKRDPNNTQVLIVSGELFEARGQLDEAARDFARAAELNAADPVPMVSLSRLSLKQLELENSLSYAQQAVACDPTNLPARVAFIDVLLACDQTGEAERHLKFIAQNDRGKPEIERLAYRLALKKGDYSAARIHLANSKAAQSSLAEHYVSGIGSSAIGSSIGLAKSRFLDEAPITAANPDLANTDGGLTLMPRSGTVYSFDESDLLEAMGDYAGARKILETTVNADPDSFEGKIKLARLLESHFHDYDGALNYFEDALKMDPLSATAMAGRDRCQAKRRNLSLQLKIALREFWAQIKADSERDQRHTHGANKTK